MRMMLSFLSYLTRFNASGAISMQFPRILILRVIAAEAGNKNNPKVPDTFLADRH